MHVLALNLIMCCVLIIIFSLFYNHLKVQYVTVFFIRNSDSIIISHDSEVT